MKLDTRILAKLSPLLFFAFGSCENEKTSTDSSAPLGSPLIEAKINSFEKLTKDYARVSKKLKDGDVSIAVRYIELEGRTRKEKAELQQELAQMTPQQAQRLASISAPAAP